MFGYKAEDIKLIGEQAKKHKANIENLAAKAKQLDDMIKTLPNNCPYLQQAQAVFAEVNHLRPEQGDMDYDSSFANLNFILDKTLELINPDTHKDRRLAIIKDLDDFAAKLKSEGNTSILRGVVLGIVAVVALALIALIIYAIPIIGLTFGGIIAFPLIVIPAAAALILSFVSGYFSFSNIASGLNSTGLANSVQSLTNEVNNQTLQISSGSPSLILNSPLDGQSTTKSTTSDPVSSTHLTFFPSEQSSTSPIQNIRNSNLTNQTQDALSTIQQLRNSDQLTTEQDEALSTILDLMQENNADVLSAIEIVKVLHENNTGVVKFLESLTPPTSATKSEPRQ